MYVSVNVCVSVYVSVSMFMFKFLYVYVSLYVSVSVCLYVHILHGMWIVHTIASRLYKFCVKAQQFSIKYFKFFSAARLLARVKARARKKFVFKRKEQAFR